MTGIFSAFTSEVFRPIATLLLPGSIAITPWFVLLRIIFCAFDRIVAANPPEAVLGFVGCALFAGFVLEDAGSSLEAKWDDKKGDDRARVWHEYLRLDLRVEPIGHRYLRSVLLRLKFELGSFWAIWTAMPGTLILGLLLCHRSDWRLMHIGLLVVFLAAMFWLAKRLKEWADVGHDILHEVRCDLVRAHTQATSSSHPPNDDHSAS